MRTRTYEIDRFEKRRIALPGVCIYCGSAFSHIDLTDEHIIPFAHGHNTLIFEKASCKPCAAIIQRYEQEVLKKQLGDFRLQVDAPSRTRRRDRPKHVEIPFVAVDGSGKITRDLGSRAFPLEEAPLALNLWQNSSNRHVAERSQETVSNGPGLTVRFIDRTRPLRWPSKKQKEQVWRPSP
ncbi:HNH endonuclease [Martelella sp.]|uniref:HNH endonuclease n=1 Tax=Martelella sp. TaxID=1969699 RepID=UPI003242B156